MRNYLNQNRQRKNKQAPRQSIRSLGLIFLICGCLSALLLLMSLTCNYNDKDSKSPPHLVSFDGGEAGDEEWSLILVNRLNPIPDSYDIKLVEVENGEEVDERIYKPLQKMLSNAVADKIYPIVVSGYRTTEKQQSLMDDKIDDYKAEGYKENEAIALAEKWVAIPGTSEHQLGLSIDINADGVNSVGDEVYNWLDKNSYKFGFIRRYPPDKTEITGVINEPWHYRYVGLKAAKEIYEQGVCLEEYLEQTV